MRATVMVLGDLGRSPRMQYHALALAENGVDVDLVGLAGSPPCPEILAEPRVTCHLLRPAGWRLRRRERRRGYAAAAALDAAVAAARLGRALLGSVGRPDLILTQVPPAIPSLPVALLAARRFRSPLVIDWHNAGRAVLALRLGREHPLVALTARAERALGRRADAHLCVSRALQAALVAEGLDRVTVLHDRPAARFRPLGEALRAEWRRRLWAELGLPSGSEALPLVVSATSWTADEDFGLLVEALARADGRLPVPLAVLITGDGEGRAAFEARVAGAGLGRVHVRTRWLAADAYPHALAAADLGLSLHRSASGLDLPMKVADMLGAGLPVCALDYGSCLAEQLRDGENALLFSDAAGLAAILCEVFADFPGTPRLDRIRAGALAARRPTWEEEWAATAGPLLLGRAARA